jgi:hypothetical protein
MDHDKTGATKHKNSLNLTTTICKHCHLFDTITNQQLKL